MPKWLVFLNSLILILLGASIVYVIELGSELQLLPSDRIGPADFLAIILTALGVIIAAVTLMVGALAIIGWNNIESRVDRKIDEKSSIYLQRRFSDDDEAYVQFVEDIKEDVRLRLLAFTRELQREWNEENEGNKIDPDA